MDRRIVILFISGKISLHWILLFVLQWSWEPVTAQEPCNVSVQITQPACPGDANGSVAVVGAPGQYTYSWSHNGALTTSFATGLNAGTYAVVVSDTSGCVSFLEAVVLDPIVPPLGSFATTNISCAGANDGSITFTLNPGLTNSWYWAHNNTLTTPTLTGLAPGGYGVVIPNPPNCPSVIWAFLGDPDIEISGATQYCPAAPPVLTTQLQWGFQPDTYVWSTGHTTSSIQVAPGTEGLVEVTATNSTLGCTATGQIFLTELPSPTVQFATPDSMCQFSEFTVNTVSSDADSLVWRWDGWGISHETDPLVSFQQAYWRPISLQGFDAFGCGNLPVMDSIYIHPVMPANFTVEQIPCSPMVKIELDSGGDSCKFYIGDSLIVEDCVKKFTHDLKRYQEYDFKFISMQGSGCNDTSAVTVDVRTEPTLFLPNAFTPDGDQINDEWPGAIDIPDKGYALRIFNRSGTLIWESRDTRERWTGEDLPIGMYIYTMQMRDPCEPVKEVARTGTITLVR